MVRLSIYILLFLLIIGEDASALRLKRRYQLNSNQMFQVASRLGVITCGAINSEWVPGKYRNSFRPYKPRIKQLRRRYLLSQDRLNKRKLKRLRKLQKLGKELCLVNAPNTGPDGPPTYASIGILNSSPAPGSIDSAQPFVNIAPIVRQGWSTLELSFNGDPGALAVTDFEITQLGGSGATPTINSVTAKLGIANTFILTLSGPINPQAYTKFKHIASNTHICLGFLPGDITQDGIVKGVTGVVDSDLDSLVDLFSRGQTNRISDINRDGITDMQDISEFVNMMRGVGFYAPGYNNTVLPQCDSQLIGNAN